MIVQFAKKSLKAPLCSKGISLGLLVADKKCPKTLSSENVQSTLKMKGSKLIKKLKMKNAKKAEVMSKWTCEM